MAKKKKKLETPAWITEGYDSPTEYEKAQEAKQMSSSGCSKELNSGAKKIGKTFKIKQCPECRGDVGVVVGVEAKGSWECRKCKWTGVDIVKKEFSEDEFMKYLDNKGEEVA